jgi:bifunctional ADP-heptose synthase (sugar kinase/adenylyltransferase)
MLLDARAVADRRRGAAAVAMIAAGFGARVTLWRLLGPDEAGRRLTQPPDFH